MKNELSQIISQSRSLVFFGGGRFDGERDTRFQKR